MKNITVVGGGPIGLRTAINLKKFGWDVQVIEEHKSIGQPVQCSGLISKTGSDALKLEIENAIVNEVKGARIYAPNNEFLQVEKPRTAAYLINREKLDKNLEKEAKRLKIDVLKECKLISARQNTVFVQKGTRGEMFKSKLVIGADGVQSKVRELLGNKIDKENFVHCMQVDLEGSFDPKYVEMHFGNFAPGFFAWVIPVNAGKARVGLGARLGTDLNKAFEMFLDRKKIEGEASGVVSGLIPVGKPLQNVVKENFALVGDAALQTKATSGGGLVTGSYAADILSETIDKHLKDGKQLKDYEKNLSKLNKELEMHWKIRRYFNSMDEEKMNKIIGKLNKLKVGEFLSKKGDMDLPSKFLPELLKSPKYLMLFPEALKYMMS